MNNDETFATLLKRYRERLTLSKTKLGGLMGVSTGYVYLLEKGKTPPPTLDRVRQLITFLALTPQEAEGLTVAAASGRTGAAEAKVLRQTGPRPVTLPDLAQKAETARGTLDPIDLGDCIAIPIPSDAMAPILTEGQLAICSRTASPRTGDIVIVTLRNGDVHFGQYYPAGEEIIVTALRPQANAPAPNLTRGHVRSVLPVIGVLFNRGQTVL